MPSRAVAVATVTTIAAAITASAFAGDPVDTATYRLTVDNTWSEETHPGLFPPDAHFSWLGGGTHDESVSFWNVGELASPGMVQMAETGVTQILIGEVMAAIADGGAGAPLDWRWWFCPDDIDHPSCGELTVIFEIDAAHPLVTLATMLGPSPDWFVGVSGLPLGDEQGWFDEVVVDLHPYDGGTRSANVFQLFGPLTQPPDPITLITAESGQIITPASLGTFTFTRLDVCPADLSGDGAIDFTDLLAVLSAWGPCTDCPADLDESGAVDFADVLAVLGTWGPCP